MAVLRQGEYRMEESITYQEIVRIGQREEARRLILRAGKTRFGRRSRKAAQTVEAITDLDQLERLVDRVLEVNSWDEFLASR
jgi:hypothetical protein